MKAPCIDNNLRSQTSTDIHSRCQGDQSSIRLRPVHPNDRDRFRKGFLELSEDSRYCRCFAFRDRLTEAELDMLCNVDNITHVALVALSLDGLGKELESIGGARFILPSPNSDQGEMAFLVTDVWQGRQVGQQLLCALIDIASERDITCLRSHLLPENIKARRLLKKVSIHTGWSIKFDEDGCLLHNNKFKKAQPEGESYLN